MKPASPTHRWIVRSLKIMIVLAVLLAVDRYVRREEIRAAGKLRYVQELERIVIPKMELHEATLEQSLAYLSAAAKKAGMQQRLRFEILSEAEAKKRFHRRIHIPSPFSVSPRIEEIEPLTDHSSSKEPKEPPSPKGTPGISIQFAERSVIDACKYVGDLANYELVVGSGTIELAPSMGDGTFEPLVETIRHVGIYGRPDGQKLANGHRDVRATMQAVGMKFYEGTSAEYDPETNTITVINTEAEIEKLGPGDPQPTRIQTAEAWLYSLIHGNTSPKTF